MTIAATETAAPSIQRSAETYLEAMLRIEKRQGCIRSIDVAHELNVTKPSVSYMTKRLRENGYIFMNQENLITLTEEGRAIALRMFERRELLTRLLLHIGVSESIAYEDAIRLEHDMSDDTYQAMKRHAETKALRQANSL